MIISVEYDGVLDKTTMQLLIRNFIEAGVIVYLISGRSQSLDIGSVRSNADLHAICDFVGIPNAYRYFTNGAYKHEIIKRFGITMHFDTKEDEIYAIKVLTNCKVINTVNVIK